MTIYSLHILSLRSFDGVEGTQWSNAIIAYYNSAAVKIFAKIHNIAVDEAWLVIRCV